MLIELDLLAYQSQLKQKKENGQRFIFDPIRRKYLVLAPEELVRQLIILYLLDQGYNKNRIRSEMGLQVNELYKRCDILLYDKALNPFMLVECKAPKVKVDQSTFEQIARYNLPLKVRYLLVTNGLHTYCCEMDYEKQSYTFLPQIPPPTLSK